jgi:hypothetical protein
VGIKVKGLSPLLSATQAMGHLNPTHFWVQRMLKNEPDFIFAHVPSWRSAYFIMHRDSFTLPLLDVLCTLDGDEFPALYIGRR